MRERISIKTITLIIILVSIPIVGFVIFQISNPEDEPFDPESDWPLLRNAVKWLCGIDDNQTSSPPKTDDNVLSNITIGCYNGEGVAQAELPILSNFAMWLGCDFITLRGTGFTNGTLDDIDVLILPGGNGAVYWNEIGPEGKSKIIEFVNQGGGYLGICAGAYRACEYTVWMDDPTHPAPDYLVSGPEKYLGLIPGVAWGPVFEIAERPDPGWGMAGIDMINRTHPITNESPETMTMFYRGGCYIEPTSNDSVTILGTYNVTGKAAIVAYEYGQGRVFVSGPHPELEERSDRDGWQSILNASDRTVKANSIIMYAIDVKQEV